MLAGVKILFHPAAKMTRLCFSTQNTAQPASPKTKEISPMAYELAPLPYDYAAL